MTRKRHYLRSVVLIILVAAVFTFGAFFITSAIIAPWTVEASENE